MHLKKISPILFLAFLAINACKKDANPVKASPQSSTEIVKTATPTIDSSTDVYVAGYVVDREAGSERAAYWKNGVLTKLGDTLSFSTAYGIAVNGNDVYVVGLAVPKGAEGFQAVVWKNGVPQFLSYGTYATQAHCIALLGNDVYVGGWANQTNNHNTAAIYWKNGVGALLPVTNADTTASRVWAITTNGTDVYMAGKTGVSWYLPFKGRAIYWKNAGAPVVLTPKDTTNESDAYSIAVNGTDVYVAGTIVSGDSGQATYWKNGVATNLGEVTLNAVYYGITTSGSDLFIVGGTPQAVNAIGTVTHPIDATLWKNNAATFLAPADYYKQSMGEAVVINNSDVYVAGGMYSPVLNIDYLAYYWKNGSAVPLSNASSNGSFACAIAVAKKN